jgi:hypothetical protein
MVSDNFIAQQAELFFEEAACPKVDEGGGEEEEGVQVRLNI